MKLAAKRFVCILLWTAASVSRIPIVGAEKKCNTCINQYVDVEETVLNSTIKNKLKEAFFPTGKDPSRFVIITYEYSICERIMDANNAEDDVICYERQSTYIWSNSAFLLLGPKPLYWFTLGAVNVPQTVNITIGLPCLCKEEFRTLLSRLTYPAKVYAAKDDHCQPMKYASKYFLEAKGIHSATYNIVVCIMTAMALLPPPAFVIFVVLAIKFVYPHTKDIASHMHVATAVDRAILASVFLTSVLMHMALGTCHGISLKSFIEYGYNVLRYDGKDENSIHKGGDKQPFALAIISGILAGAIFLVAVPFAFVKGTKNQDWKVPFSTSLTVNFVYIGFNFLPYMLMAFVSDPTQTLFTYILIVVVVICVYWFIYRLIIATTKCCKHCRGTTKEYHKQHCQHCRECCSTFWLLVMAIALILSVVLIMVIISYMLTLGNIHDFQDIENISTPFVVALIGFVLVSPVYERLREWNHRIQAVIPLEPLDEIIITA